VINEPKLLHEDKTQWVRNYEGIDRGKEFLFIPTHKTNNWNQYYYWAGGKWVPFAETQRGRRKAIRLVDGIPFRLTTGKGTPFTHMRSSSGYPVNADARQTGIAMERDRAVWIRDALVLTRWKIIRDEKGEILRYDETSQYRIPQGGQKFNGPWVAGRWVYYALDSELYRMRIPAPKPTK
jgi:hypothetical protein